jgi:dUTP pyrophosphatase
MSEVQIMLDGGAQWQGTAHLSDAGFDLTATEEWIIQPNNRAVVATGVHVNMPANMVGYVMPRSGLAAKRGVTVLNAPGVIDSGYTGEIGVCLINLGAEPYYCHAGDNIAQLVFQKVKHPQITFVDSMPETKRGGNGFGSTGA